MFLDNLSMGNHSNRFIPFIWPYIRASISSLTVSMTFESFQFGSFFSPSRGTFPSPCALSSFSSFVVSRPQIDLTIYYFDWTRSLLRFRYRLSFPRSPPFSVSPSTIPSCRECFEEGTFGWCPSSIRTTRAGEIIAVLKYFFILSKSIFFYAF